jgi:hypothetical protein
MDSRSQSPKKDTRREIIKKAAYVAPAILTLAAFPAREARGSVRPPNPGSSPRGSSPPGPSPRP